MRSCNAAYPDRHVGMALRFLARPVLPQAPAAQEPASILCQPVLNGRTQWRVLPNPDTGSGNSLARTDRQRFCFCLEGLQIHHALETAFCKFDHQSLTAGKPPFPARRKGGTHPVSASAEFPRQCRKAQIVLRNAAEQPTLQLRVSAPELV